MTQENSTIDISKILDSEEIRTQTIEAGAWDRAEEAYKRHMENQDV